MSGQDNSKVVRVAVFYDGSFFMRVTDYYKFQHDLARHISFPGLEKFIQREIASAEGLRGVSACQIVESHFFKGKLTISQLQEKYPDKEDAFQFLKRERLVEELLMVNNTVLHNYELRWDHETKRLREKGIDVWLAIEAFDMAVHTKFDVLALFAGDEDYIPLIRKINSLGIKAALVPFDLEGTDRDGSPRFIRTSAKLLDEASLVLDLHAMIESASTPEQIERRDSVFVG